jgi:hypothetical protein
MMPIFRAIAALGGFVSGDTRKMPVRENLFVSEALDDVCACSGCGVKCVTERHREVGLIDVRAKKGYF